MPSTATSEKRPPALAPGLDPHERARLERAFAVPRARFLLAIPVAVALLVWSFVGAEFDFAKLGEGAVNMGDFLSRMFPPTWARFNTIVALLIETLQMAVVGSVLGAVLSLIVAFGAASNIAPRWLYYPTRWVMNVIRSLPDLVFALMFVSAVGLGPFAGILAMTVGSIGSIGKVFAEAMESVDEGPITAMRAVGASPRQVVQYGILPQSAPLLVSYTLLLFEGNVRGATILGMVGAGGIGLELTTAMKMYDYGHLSAIVICIIARHGHRPGKRHHQKEDHMTLIDAPVLALSDPVNLRDLAGIPVAGGVVREGFAIRADDLAIVTEAYADRLVANGLRTVIDLRSAAEVEATGRGPLGSRTSVNYHHVPFMAAVGEVDAAEMADQSRFGAFYLRMFEGAAAQIVTSLAIIAHAPGAVAFHCAAGQDRTGVLAASLLLALGAEPADIVADYTRTGENSAAIMTRIAPTMRALMDRLGFDLDEAARAATRTAFSSEPMRHLLAGLAERHTDLLAPLRAAGLDDALIARLRAGAVA